MRVALAALLLTIAARGHAADMPRLTGTLIAPGERTALFSTEAGGTTPVTLGDHIGDYTVTEIEPGRVQLGNANRRVVVSVEAAATAPPPRDSSRVTFGLVLRQPGPADQ